MVKIREIEKYWRYEFADGHRENTKKDLSAEQLNKLIRAHWALVHVTEVLSINAQSLLIRFGK